MKPQKKQPIVLATNNKHKTKEIKAILKKAGLKVQVLTLDDFPKMKPVVENKPTIEGNALKKASEVAKKLKIPALSDDTGLFVEALKGAPGVYSARYAGKNPTFEDNNRKVLRLMEKCPSPRRWAVFRCVAAFALPNGKKGYVHGKITGKITPGLSGKKGFGYDPIFYVPSERKTFAEMSKKRKNEISHRARAFRKAPALIKRLLKSL